MKRVWWVQYKRLIDDLAVYLQNHTDDLPVELRSRAAQVLAQVSQAKTELAAYDAVNPRGKGV